MSERTGVCEHGNLARQCLTCELTQERDDARAALAIMTEQRDAAEHNRAYVFDQVHEIQQESEGRLNRAERAEAALAAAQAENVSLTLQLKLVRDDRDRFAARLESAQAERDEARHQASELSTAKHEIIDDLEGALAEARRVLRIIEWGEKDGWCRICTGFDDAGHAPNCALAAVLAQEAQR